MRYSPVHLLLALVVWISSNPTVAIAGKSARRAAENCKSEDCEAGSGGSMLGGLILVALVVLFAIWAEWSDRKEREKRIAELESNKY